MFPIPPVLRIRSFARSKLREVLGPPPKRQEERKRGLMLCTKSALSFAANPLTNRLDAGSPRVDEVFDSWAVIELVYKKMSDQTSVC
ncbi:MAG: hypothetical protein DMF76_25600 [Acidobacteria bacterium]|nr:MAG: hypothetical protein DMF76_25600 [Acidobacteriota bacterium]